MHGLFIHRTVSSLHEGITLTYDAMVPEASIHILVAG